MQGVAEALAAEGQLCSNNTQRNNSDNSEYFSDSESESNNGGSGKVESNSNDCDMCSYEDIRNLACNEVNSKKERDSSEDSHLPPVRASINLPSASVATAAQSASISIPADHVIAEPASSISSGNSRIEELSPPKSRISVSAIAYRLAKDWIKAHGSLLLCLVFLPLALFQIALAQVQRMWRVGSVYLNLSHLVSDTDESIMETYLASSAVSLSKRIRDKSDSLTSVQLVKAYIRQINRTNLFLNAVVASRFARALAEAAEVDAAVKAGLAPPEGTYPLYGVPVLVKECFEVNIHYSI